MIKEAKKMLLCHPELRSICTHILGNEITEKNILEIIRNTILDIKKLRKSSASSFFETDIYEFIGDDYYNNFIHYLITHCLVSLDKGLIERKLRNDSTVFNVNLANNYIDDAIIETQSLFGYNLRWINNQFYFVRTFSTRCSLWQKTFSNEFQVEKPKSFSKEWLDFNFKDNHKLKKSCSEYLFFEELDWDINTNSEDKILKFLEPIGNFNSYFHTSIRNSFREKMKKHKRSTEIGLAMPSALCSLLSVVEEHSANEETEISPQLAYSLVATIMDLSIDQKNAKKIVQLFLNPMNESILFGLKDFFKLVYVSCLSFYVFYRVQIGSDSYKKNPKKMKAAQKSADKIMEYTSLISTHIHVLSQGEFSFPSFDSIFDLFEGELNLLQTKDNKMDSNYIESLLRLVYVKSGDDRLKVPLTKSNTGYIVEGTEISLNEYLSDLFSIKPGNFRKRLTESRNTLRYLFSEETGGCVL